MYKSQYDNDVTLWSPAGRLHQLEYACSAVTQGSVVLGLKSSTHAVLVGLRRSPSDLAFHQEKLFKIDSHCAIGVSGLISDGRRLCKYMRSETLNHRYVYNSSMPLSRLVLDVADKCQGQTITSQGRPFGVGLLVIGYDSKGAHLYETDPAGHYFEYFAHAIGARNQAAKTYLEKKYETFPNAGMDELIQHGVNALKETVRTRDLKLTTDNVSVIVVGENTDTKQLNDEELQPFVDKVEGDGGDDNDGNDGGDDAKPKSAMDVDK
mmetsp:Transcript_14347/g.22427  ORF Transcript_14347/g.22427 Transcript_14347/m.22427 type:complete len:265 (-) Transcript_14347:257-1051(-)|eukprot:CAMPEP_0197026126 /NCGR_PEP_ID=MMETSP1384-20130603/6291_1 /TAXON_ID=29189 /ORGANISM="Ammonia sp." /LENGTH=264 /DNA_ID=CAMNT_0042454737 /DNA_START=59 /DNA_END=853 /DNA_ORIENTATION=-